MPIKRTTEIFVETTRRFVFQPEAGERIFCRICGAPMLTAEHLAAVNGISRRAIYQAIETGETHFAEIETGAVLICPPSLAAMLCGDEETNC